MLAKLGSLLQEPMHWAADLPAVLAELLIGETDYTLSGACVKSIASISLSFYEMLGGKASSDRHVATLHE